MACSDVQNLFHLLATCSISACVRLLEMICLFREIILTFWWDNNKMTDVEYKLREKKHSTTRLHFSATQVSRYVSFW